MKTLSSFISKLLLAAVACASVATAQTESLYPLDRVSMTADKVAAHRGDILTVVVSETTTVSSTTNTTTSKESSINNAVGQFLFSTAASGFGTHNEELPATNITGNNEYQGGGTVSVTSTLADRFSVMVKDRLPNGNLVIEGARKREYAGEMQYIIFSGIVRYYDITGANTVDSSQIHNANIQYISEGVITNAQEKGWLERLNEIINPF